MILSTGGVSEILGFVCSIAFSMALFALSEKLNLTRCAN